MEKAFIPQVLSDDVLLHIAHEALTQKHYVGVLLHGSHAQGYPDPNSDIDLIYVVNNRQQCSYTRRIRSMEVDLCAAPARFFERAMETDRKNNNNFLLRAFATGRELSASNDVLPRLIQKAKRIWQRGPIPASFAEKNSLAEASVKACVSVRRRVLRAGSSREWREMAAVECSISFQRMLYGYCRANGLWSSALSEMLRWSDPRYAGINSLSRAYLAAGCLEERVSVLEEISKAILHPCEPDHNNHTFATAAPHELASSTV